MPHAAKGKGGDHVQGRRSIFIGWKEYWKLGSRKFSGYGIQTGARTSARAFGTEKERNYSGNYSTVKSAQRLSATLSIRPSGRVQIIDM